MCPDIGHIWPRWCSTPLEKSEVVCRVVSSHNEKRIKEMSLERPALPPCEETCKLACSQLSASRAARRVRVLRAAADCRPGDYPAEERSPVSHKMVNSGWEDLCCTILVVLPLAIILWKLLWHVRAAQTALCNLQFKVPSLSFVPFPGVPQNCASCGLTFAQNRGRYDTRPSGATLYTN